MKTHSAVPRRVTPRAPFAARRRAALLCLFIRSTRSPFDTPEMSLLLLLLLPSPPQWWRWSIPLQAFFAAIAFFHLSEFLITARYNRDLLSHRSFLVSRPYLTAMALGLLEYAAEMQLLGAERKASSPAAFGAFCAGAALVVLGEALRKTAMVQAGRAFTHDLQASARTPRVVEHGFYAWCRHPGYLGWMMWAPATQLMLANPLACVGFAVAAWRFFAARVPQEERLLLLMYGEAYRSYARRTPTRMPGIKGLF